MVYKKNLEIKFWLLILELSDIPLPDQSGL
jgi:hypothetical protein